MRSFDFENSVGYLMCSTAHILRKAVDDCLSDEGLTCRQWEVLAVLSRQGTVSQRELAESLGIEAPAMAGIVRRMERDGWLHRNGCPDDRRRTLIRPTEKADAVWSRSIDCIYQMREDLFDGLTDMDVEAVKHICTRIQENFATMRAEPLTDPALVTNESCSS